MRTATSSPAATSAAIVFRALRRWQRASFATVVALGQHTPPLVGKVGEDHQHAEGRTPRAGAVEDGLRRGEAHADLPRPASAWVAGACSVPAAMRRISARGT